MTAATPDRKYALAKLEDLARCRRIVPQGGGEDEMVCLNDLIGVFPTRGGFIHDQREIARLRENALGEVWPE